MGAKYITTASGEPILSWVTMYTISLSVISYNNSVKVRSLYNLSSQRKKKYAEEVTFAFKIFSTGKS